MRRPRAGGDRSPSQNRQLRLNKDWNCWKEAILHDLERVHPEIRQCVSRIDVMRMGDATARPKRGAIFSAQRRKLANACGRILFANSDLIGFSIFEGANTAASMQQKQDSMRSAELTERNTRCRKAPARRMPSVISARSVPSRSRDTNAA